MRQRQDRDKSTPRGGKDEDPDKTDTTPMRDCYETKTRLILEQDETKMSQRQDRDQTETRAHQEEAETEFQTRQIHDQDKTDMRLRLD